MAGEDALSQIDWSVLGPIGSVLQPVFFKLSVLVGGIFGLMVILAIIRIYYERKQIKLLEKIHHDVSRLNVHLGVAPEKRHSVFTLVSKLWEGKKKRK